MKEIRLKKLCATKGTVELGDFSFIVLSKNSKRKKNKQSRNQFHVLLLLV